MIIPIQLSPGGDQEYAIVELQGEVQVTGAAGSSSSDGLGGLPLGELSINPLVSVHRGESASVSPLCVCCSQLLQQGKPVLVIGGHKLIGKFVTLPKRLAVLEYKDRQEPQQPCGTPSKVCVRRQPLSIVMPSLSDTDPTTCHHQLMTRATW